MRGKRDDHGRHSVSSIHHTLRVPIHSAKQNVSGTLGVGIAALLFFTHAPAANAAGPLRKLTRGVANLATGWLELPFRVARTTEDDGSIAGATVGLGGGVWYGVKRTVIGAWETATWFLANHPRQVGSDFYGPLIEPEFVTYRATDKP